MILARSPRSLSWCARRCVRHLLVSGSSKEVLSHIPIYGPWANLTATRCRRLGWWGGLIFVRFVRPGCHSARGAVRLPGGDRGGRDQRGSERVGPVGDRGSDNAAHRPKRHLLWYAASAH